VPTLPADVPVIRLEDAGMAEQMAEYVTAATLGAFREQAVYALQQQQERWAPRPRLVKSSFGIGILGVGVLGQAVARALVAFDFPVYGWGRSYKTLPGIRVFAGAGELPTFLAQSRVLVCLLPSTPDTRDFIDRSVLAQLPRGAHFINIARGDIVVEHDLMAALESGQLDSATLDVFHDEPLPAGHPFWHHPRITITPHVSGITLVDDAMKQIATKIRRLEQSLPVSGVVNRERGY
jgi:glyoxylate/hydroxypyruvate reductase A